MLYTTDRPFRELGVLQQKIQLERHLAHGVCPHLGPPFTPEELTESQYAKYKQLWPINLNGA